MVTPSRLGVQSRSGERDLEPSAPVRSHATGSRAFRPRRLAYAAVGPLGSLLSSPPSVRGSPPVQSGTLSVSSSPPAARRNASGACTSLRRRRASIACSLGVRAASIVS